MKYIAQNLQYLSVWLILFLASVTQAKSSELRAPPLETSYANLSEILTQIKFQLADQVHLSEVDIKWKELEDFEREIYRVSALDPTELLNPHVPTENISSHLNGALEQAWIHVKTSAPMRLTDLECIAFKKLVRDVEKILRERGASHFQSARMYLKTGDLQKTMDLVKNEYSKRFKVTPYTIAITRNPDHPGLSALIENAQFHVDQLGLTLGSRKPASVPQADSVRNPLLITVFGIFLFMLGMVSTNFFQSKSVPAQKTIQHPSSRVTANAGPVFDYRQWLKDFEMTLLSVGDSKNQFDKFRSIALESIERLREARVGLQLATTEKEYHANLSKLNASAPALEEYIITQKSGGEFGQTQEVILKLLELTDAIEQNRPINIENFSQVRALRDELLNSNSIRS